MASQELIDNEPVKRTESDRAAMLANLLQKNHADFSMLANGTLHNHLPHILGSAFWLGGSAEHFQQVFTTVTADLEAWPPSELTITDYEGLHEMLGDVRYQRALVVYFQRRLADFQGDWEGLMLHYLLEIDHPLFGGLVGGFGHPLIHVTDAVEMANSSLAVEALALTAVDFSPLAQLLDAPSATVDQNTSALEVFQQIRSDHTFDNLFAKPGVQNTKVILTSAPVRRAAMGYVQSLDLTSATDEAQDAHLFDLTNLAVLLLCTTSKRHSNPQEQESHSFDFYLTHSLTFCWSLRVLGAWLPASTKPKLYRAVWLLLVLAYIHQRRPLLKPEVLNETSLGGGDLQTVWRSLKGGALDSTKLRGGDPHYVKVIRTLWEFALLWPKEEVMFLKAAVRFGDEFAGWTGFGVDGEEEMDIAA